MRIACPILKWGKDHSNGLNPMNFFWMRFEVSKGGDCYANSMSELKTSKIAKKMVGATGFEPTTSTPPE